jgi:heavy metal sensor kinase
MLTIKAKVIFAYTLVFGLMFFGFALLIYQSTLDAETSKLDAFLSSHADKIQTEIEEQWSEHQFPTNSEFDKIATEGLVHPRVQIRSTDGKVLVSDTLLANFAGGTGTGGGTRQGSYYTARFGGEKYRVLVIPAEVEGTDRFVVEVAATQAGVDASLERLRWLFIISIPCALILASLAAYLITRAGFSPLARMMTTARNISSDNLGSRLAVPTTHDEIRLLGDTLNGMIERIQKAFESQKQFIADASHEIRTPLTIICSELESIQQLATNKKTKESLRVSLLEVDRLSKMTENMLMLSRLDALPLSLERQTVRLDEIIVECVQSMDALYRRKRVPLHVRIDEAVEIVADREGMKRVFLNLLDNGLRYTRPGGSVSVSLSLTGNSALPVCVNVEDTGSGIAPEDIPHIFERFYRATSSRAGGSGSGLGLAIVDRLVKLHGGTVTVQSTLKKGSKFCVYLPFSSHFHLLSLP